MPRLPCWSLSSPPRRTRSTDRSLAAEGPPPRSVRRWIRSPTRSSSSAPSPRSRFEVPRRSGRSSSSSPGSSSPSRSAPARPTLSPPAPTGRRRRSCRSRQSPSCSRPRPGRAPASRPPRTRCSWRRPRSPCSLASDSCCVPNKRPPTLPELEERMSAIHSRLRRRKLTVAAAESCTGGLLAAVLTSHGGSSEYFKGGAVVYSNEAKTILADVAPNLIHGHGAVSSVVAGALARGARERLGAKIGLGITGIAGPGGATPGKKVGLTYVAVDSDDHSVVKKYEWPYDREGNRLASVGAAIDLLEKAIA